MVSVAVTFARAKKVPATVAVAFASAEKPTTTVALNFSCNEIHSLCVGFGR